MRRLRATYRITTPMFLGGADQSQAVDTVRIPSFKGALRFWWRASALARHGGDWRAVHAEELRLLGSAEASIGQSRVSLSLGTHDALTVRRVGATLDPGTAYLAGQGLYHFRNCMMRPAAEPGARFTVQLLMRRGVTDAQCDGLVRALRVLGACGGLGSRARHGLGSIVLERWELDGQPHVETLATQEALLSEVLRAGSSVAREPEYSAFSAQTRVVLLKGSAGVRAEAWLEEVGAELVRYRSYGNTRRRGHTVLNEPAEQRFSADHDLVYDFARGRGGQPQHAPARAVFGLPHNYFFSSSTTNVGIKPAEQTRRASPLLLHVQDREGEPPVAVLTFLPARFLPEGEGVKMSSKGVREVEVPMRTGEALWEPIQTLLDRLMGQQTRRGAREIKVAAAVEVGA